MNGETPLSDELQRRIEALEKKVPHSGSLWDVATAFIPVWLVILTIAVFAGSVGWEYYQKSQQELAKTQRLQIERALAEVKGRAANAAEPQKLKAELQAKQEEAHQARVEADARRREADGATLREKQVAAELQNKKAKAAKAKADADAMTAKFGSVKTLEERAARAKLIVTEMEATRKRSDAAIDAASGKGAYLALNEAGIDGACAGNRYAELIDCPTQYWPRQAPSAPQSRPSAPDATSASAMAAASAMQERFATVATQTLNLRSCPAANCEKIVEMPQGYRAKVIGDAGNGWTQLEVTFQDGRKAKGFSNAKHLHF